MDRKFTALRIIGTIYKIAGVLIALGMVLAVIMLIVGSAVSGSMLRTMGFDNVIGIIVAVIVTFIGGGLTALSVYAIGEGLYLLINLEENTRFSSMILRDRLYPPAQSAQPSNPQRPVMPSQQPPVV